VSTTATPAARQAHVHDAFRCPAHVDFCGCPDLEGCLCNPYHVAGHCPDAIEMMPWSGVFHAITPDGQTPTSCCGRLPGELAGRDDAMTADPAQVNCTGALP
jgi:hypothetical protein